MVDQAEREWQPKVIQQASLAQGRFELRSPGPNPITVLLILNT